MQEIHEETRNVAYELYEQRGMAHGYDLDDWLEAERTINSKNNISMPTKERKLNSIKSKKKGDKR